MLKPVDAAAEAMRRRTASADGDEGPGAGPAPAAAVGEAGESPDVTCPSCGRETDADLDFCHWCTEPLPWAEPDDR